MPWFGHVLAVLAVGDKDAAVWNFDYPSLCRQIQQVSEELAIPFVPYMVRHSGPSWDRLQNRRTLAEIQKRGMWAARQSVARCEDTRSAWEYLKIDQQTRAWLEARSRRSAVGR